jgi:hypothetical protein
MKKRSLFAAALVLLAGPAFSQSLGQLIMASLFGNAASITMKITMHLSAENGSKERGLEVFIRRDAGIVRILAHVVSPAFLSQMKFLTHRRDDGETSSWLKTSQGVRKLSSTNTEERVFDSDFTVEDFGQINPGEFTIDVLADSEVDGVPCAVLDLRPKLKATYARKVFFIEKVDSQLRGIDFFDEGGNFVRQYRLLETRIIGGAAFPVSSVMKDLRGKTETRLTVNEIDTTHPLPDRVFNKADL